MCNHSSHQYCQFKTSATHTKQSVGCEHFWSDFSWKEKKMTFELKFFMFYRDLDYNPITNIEDGTFSGLDKLEEL